MTTYIMTETQNRNSHREGVKFQSKNLTSAKRKATSLQVFEGTFLELCEDGVTVAVKESNGKWINQKYFD